VHQKANRQTWFGGPPGRRKEALTTRISTGPICYPTELDSTADGGGDGPRDGLRGPFSKKVGAKGGAFPGPQKMGGPYAAGPVFGGGHQNRGPEKKKVAGPKNKKQKKLLHLSMRLPPKKGGGGGENQWGEKVAIREPNQPPRSAPGGLWGPPREVFQANENPRNPNVHGCLPFARWEGN